MGKETSPSLAESKSFCVLPWKQFASTTFGLARPCGWVRYDLENLPKLLDREVSEVWNSEYFKSLRREMLRGEFPSACEKCYHLEKLGDVSKRVYANDESTAEEMEFFRKHTLPDGEYTQGPMALDIRVANLCNLKCVTCGTGNSSKWFEDKRMIAKYENLSGRKEGKPEVFQWNDSVGELAKFVAENSESIQEIRFSGGEPLMSKGHYQILDTLIEKEMFDIRLFYTSNLLLLNETILKRWRKFNDIQINISMDGVDDQFNYIRYPANWEELEKKLRLLLENTDRMKLRVQMQWTASNLSLYYLPETYRRFKERFADVPFGFGCHVEYPRHLSPKNLPPELKQEIRNKIDIEQFGKWQNVVNGFIQFMLSEDTWDQHGETLRSYLEDVDEARALNWRRAFPEIAHHISC